MFATFISYRHNVNTGFYPLFSIKVESNVVGVLKHVFHGFIMLKMEHIMLCCCSSVITCFLEDNSNVQFPLVQL